MSDLSVIAACLRGKEDPYWRDRVLKCNVRGLLRGQFRAMLREQAEENNKVIWTEDRGWFSSDFIVNADWKTWYMIDYLAERLGCVNYEEVSCEST